MDQDINKWTIYMYTFPNGKRYIGATIHSLSQRHGSDWSKYKKNKLLSNAIKEYGIDSIVPTVLFEGLMENRIAAEIEAFFIEAYKTNVNRYNNPSYGYNQTDGGEGTTKKNLSEERKAHLREQIRSLNLERLGSHPSEEVRRRQSEAQWNKRGPIPLEIRKERADKRKGYNAVNGVKKVPHKISVVVHNTLTGETLRFPSISSVARHYGMKEGNISEIINGRRASPSGYIFVTEDNVDEAWEITEFYDKKSNAGNQPQSIIVHDPKINKTMRFESKSAFCEYFKLENTDRVETWLIGKEIMPLGLIFVREEDGIPSEWNPVTLTAEEIEAGDSKYHLKNYLRETRKSRQPIIIHNPKTEETLHFDSVTAAADYYGICYETVSRWLNRTQKPSNGLIVIREHDLDPSLNWDVKHIKVERVSKKRSNITPIIMHNEITNETFSFKSIRDAAYFLDVTKSTLTRWICGERRPPKGYVFIKKEDFDPSLGWEVKEVS